MNLKTISLITTAAILSAAMPAHAGNIADCEVVIMEYVSDEDGGGMTVASFRPAGDFLESVYTDSIEIVREIDGSPIRAIMCRRNDLVPDKDDFALVATGIPFALSQDFDTDQSDSLTVYFKDGKFQYKYASAYPMNDEVKDLLDAQMKAFTKADHGLGTDAP